VPRSERDRIIEEVIATEHFWLVARCGSISAAKLVPRSGLAAWLLADFGRFRPMALVPIFSAFQHARLMPVRFSPSWPSAHRFVRAVRPPDPSQDIHAAFLPQAAQLAAHGFY
jgi:hypothetical protein